MSHVSRPMQVALAAVLLLLVVWFVALRPKPSSGEDAASAPAQTAPAPAGGAAPGTEGLTNAIDKAHGAGAPADADAQRAAQSDADAPAASAGGASAPAGAGSERTR